MAGLNVAEGRVDDGLINLDFNRICRLCLNFCPDYIDLRPSNGNRNAPRHIIDQIKYCYCIKIDLAEPLPSKVCLQCIQILTLLCATKRNIKYSELMLRNIVTLRNARHGDNTQNRQEANVSILQRLLTGDSQGEQECPVLQNRPTQVNSQIQNLRMRPIQMTTMQELYTKQNQALGDSSNENLPTQTKPSQSAGEHSERENEENPSTNMDDSNIEKENEDKENIENKPVKIKLDESSDSNSNSVESSSGSNCSTSTDSILPEKDCCKTSKTIEEDNNRSMNKKSNLMHNMNKRKSFEIDMTRDLRVKLEVLDLKNIKFCSLNTSGLSGSTEGRGSGTSGESRSGKVVKEIGTVIDESNILSPKAKRMRKSIPKR